MAEKRKTSKDQIASAAMLIPTALGISMYKDRLPASMLDTLRDIMPDNLIKTAINHLSGSGRYTSSGSKATSVLLKKASGVSEDMTGTKFEQTLRNNRDVARALFKDKITGTTGRINKLVNAITESPGNALEKYAAFLAYKRTYGLERAHINNLTITYGILEQYWNLFNKNIKKDDRYAAELRANFLKLRAEMDADPDKWGTRYKNLMSEVAISSTVDPKPHPRNISHDPITLQGDHPTEGIEHDLKSFITEGNSEALETWQALGPAAKDRSAHQAKSITTAIANFQNELKQAQEQATKYYKNAVILNGDPESLHNAKETMDNLNSLKIKIHKRTQYSGGITHKSIVMEIASDNPNLQSQFIPFNIQRGGYTTRSISTLPTTNLLHSGITNTSQDGLLDITSIQADRLGAMAHKYFNDAKGAFGNPERGRGLINSINKEVFAFSSPASGTPRDILRGTSVLFEDMNIALGLGTRTTHRKLVQGIPTLDRLARLGPGNENIMIFDMEFTHPDLSRGQVGSQKINTSPHTKVFQISARVFNAKNWEEQAAMEVLIDPGPEAVKNAREFYRTKITDAAGLEDFLAKELQGADKDFGRNRYRRRSFNDAMKLFLRFAQEHSISHVGGQNIRAADIEILNTKMEAMSGLPDDLKSLYAKLFRIDGIHGTDQVLLDSYDAGFTLNYGKYSRSGSLDKLLEQYTGLDDTAFGKILEQASRKQHKEPTALLKELAKEFDVTVDRVRSVYNQVRDMKMTVPKSALGYHNAAFDTAMNAVVLRFQQQDARNLPLSKYKYHAIHQASVEVLQNGNTSWATPFSVMDMFREGVFEHEDTPENDAFALSLFSSSQQQAAKLIGSSLQMQHLIPFGFMSNVMRQRYQAFSGYRYAPATEEAIAEARAAGFKYMPGELITTQTGRKLHQAFSDGLGGYVHPEDMGKRHTGLVLPTLYLPESFVGVLGDQSYIHEQVGRIATYFHGHSKKITFDLDLPAKWSNMTPSEIFYGKGGYKGVRDDLAPAIAKALERRISMNPDFDTLTYHSSVQTALSDAQMAAIYDTGVRGNMRSMTEVMYNKKSIGLLKDFVLAPGEEIYGSSGTQSAAPVYNKNPYHMVVSDTQFDWEAGKVVVTLQRMNMATPGVKLSGDDTKTFKAGSYGSLVSGDEALGFHGDKVAVVTAARYGGSRQEVGSFFHVQMGRALEILNNDPRYTRNPAKLKARAKEVFRGFLGDEVTYIAHPTGGGEYRLEVVLPSYETRQMYDMLTGENMLDMLRKSNINWGMVEHSFKDQLKTLSPADQKVVSKGYDEIITKNIRMLQEKIADLEKIVYASTDGRAVRNAKAAIRYHKEMLRSIKNYHQNNDKSGVAWFDVSAIKYGHWAAAATSFKASSSLRITDDIMDYMDSEIDKMLETSNKMPQGSTRFRPYSAMMMEENILKWGAGSEELTRLIKLGLGISYVNSEGKIPIADGLAVLKQSIEFIKHGTDSTQKYESIEDLFKSVAWLKEYAQSSDSAFVQSIHGIDKYNLMDKAQTQLILDTMNQTALSAEIEEIEKALPEGTNLIDKMVASGMTEEDAANLIKRRSLQVYAETLKGKAIFDPTSNKSINIFQIRDAEQILKEHGYTDEMIMKDPHLRKLTTQKLKLDFMQDIALKLLEDSDLDDITRERLKGIAKKYPDSTKPLKLLAMPQLKESLESYKLTVNGKKAYLFDKSFRSIYGFVEQYQARDSILTQLEDHLTAHNGQISSEAAKRMAVELEVAQTDFKASVLDYMDTYISKNLRHINMKGSTFFSRAKYGRHASGMNKVLPVLQQVLGSAEYRKKHLITDREFRHVLALAAYGNKEQTNLILDPKTSQKTLLELSEQLAERNKKVITFGGFGLNEGFMARSEAGTLYKRYISTMNKQYQMGMIPKEDLIKFKARATAWLTGAGNMYDVTIKMPDIGHGMMPVRGLATVDDKILSLAGIEKSKRAFIFTHPFRSLWMTDAADFDGDLMAQIDMGMHQAFEKADAMYAQQQSAMADFFKAGGHYKDDFNWPVQTNKPVFENDRVLLSKTGDNALVFDYSDDYADLYSGMYESQSARAKESIIIKAFTGQIGASSMRMTGRMAGAQAPFRMLPGLLRDNQELAEVLLKESGLSAEDVTGALDYLEQEYTDVNGKSRTLYDSLMKWRYRMNEAVAIKKDKVVGDLNIVSYLSELSEAQKRMELGEMTSADIEFFNKSPVLASNKIRFIDRLDVPKGGASKEDVARRALQAANTMDKMFTTFQRVVTGKNDPHYMEVISRRGLSGVNHMLAEMLNENPAMAPSLLAHRHGIERMYGLGANPFEYTASDIGLVSKDNGAFRKVFGRVFDPDLLKESVAHTMESLMGSNWSGSMKAGALALGAVMFFSPNMGVEPVGRGGEAEDWPELPSLKKVNVSIPHPSRIEHLVKALQPGHRRRGVTLHLPPRPLKDVQHSDLRNRNWTMDEYLRRSDAILMT